MKWLKATGKGLAWFFTFQWFPRYSKCELCWVWCNTGKEKSQDHRCQYCMSRRSERVFNVAVGLYKDASSQPTSTYEEEAIDHAFKQAEMVVQEHERRTDGLITPFVFSFRNMIAGRVHESAR